MDQPVRPNQQFISPKLGEELPIFCEKCGYSLVGLSQNRCSHCAILQFKCPECGHNQPINTLRPAFQTFLGRLRGAWLVGSVFFRFAFFIFTLFAWFIMGAEFSFMWDYNRVDQTGRAVGRPIDPEALIAFGVYGFFWAGVARMMLIRWRHGWRVGAVLASLVCAAIALGVWTQRVTGGSDSYRFVSLDPTFYLLVGIASLMILLAATIAWGVWTALVRAFLPRRTGDALLHWQRSLSNDVSALAREPTAMAPAQTPEPLNQPAA